MECIEDMAILSRGWLFNKKVTTIKLGDFILDRTGRVKAFHIESSSWKDFKYTVYYELDKNMRNYYSQVIKNIRLRVDKNKNECFIELNDSPYFKVSIDGIIRVC